MIFFLKNCLIPWLSSGFLCFAGCKRQLSALRLQKSLDKNIFLALLAVPSPVFMLSSASYSYKTTTAWVLQKPHSRDAFLSLLPAPDQICNFNTSCRLHFWKDLVQNNQKETPSESAAVDLQTSNTQLSGTSATPVKDKSSDSGTSAGGGTTGSSAPEVDQKSHKVLTGTAYNIFPNTLKKNADKCSLY